MEMDINKFRKSKYLKKEELEGNPALVTIDHCEEINVAREGESPDEKCVLFFKENIKPYAANWTALKKIKEIVGNGDAGKWGGTEIVLKLDKNITFGDKKTGGIVVEDPHSEPEVQAQPQRPPTQPSGPNPNHVGDDPPPIGDDDIPF